MRVVVAFDHRGVKLRERVLATLGDLGHEAVDAGVDAPEPPVDYPDTARDVGAAIRAGDAERAATAVGDAISMLDRTAGKGIIHKNNAARRKSRLMAKYNRLARSATA
jgi:ribose 5-phosphate isomerase RpiB